MAHAERGGEVFHTAMSFRNVRADLEDKQLLERVAETVINHFGLDVVETHWHQYEPIGLTGVYVLMQSSLTLHTWSEFNKLVIDVTTCGKQVDIREIRDSLLSQLDTDSVTISSEIL